MKTVFDKATRDELIARIGNIDAYSTALWGKMTVYQMLKHCTQWDEMAAGRRVYKRLLLGRLIGKMVLRGMVKDDTPMKPNMPTVPEFIVTGSGDVPAEKAKWITLIEGYAVYPNRGFVHPFFGALTHEQVGILAFKHADHHLRQFSC